MSNYAKTYKTDRDTYIGQTIEEHTKDLLKECETLQAYYSDVIDIKDDWQLLKSACAYHDLGKMPDIFQNKLRKKLHKALFKIPAELCREIPHNYLSPAFIPESIDDESFFLLFYAIAYHHKRDIKFDEGYLRKVIEKDLSGKLNDLTWVKNLGFEVPEEISGWYFGYLKNKQNFERIKNDRRFIMLKGLLHRLDHAASARVPVEKEPIKNMREKLIAYLTHNIEGFRGLKDFQKQAALFQNNNVLLIASTGMGKSEFALSWIGDAKAFYTLPLRVSVNAMYERFKAIVYDNVSLLHSNSLLYGIDALDGAAKENLPSSEELSIEEHIYRTNQTRQLSFPLTVTTADQLFTSVFKWDGYEKIYATLAYSKVILDEPQAYTPETLAMIIQCLTEISGLGGRFCFMSATIHPFVRNELDNICTLIGPVYNEEAKHKITMKQAEIGGLADDIEYYYKKGKKVLVICNTVKKAQEVYKQLKGCGNVKLLHSCFIQKDRVKKEQGENGIINDYKKNTPVIWVTTQIVEASLDIDYDVLFTELASLDALIQRMGRIYRRWGRIITDTDIPNIIIALENPSGRKTIYDSGILDLTERYISEYDGLVLSDENKQELMNIIFDKKHTKAEAFYKKFKDTLDLLELGFEAPNKTAAQKLFREIANITVIPESVYAENQDIIEMCMQKIYAKELALKERILYINQLNQFTLSLPLYRVPKEVQIPLHNNKRICRAYLAYDHDSGIIMDRKEMIPYIEIL
ncbi:MAG: CRISPR-associated helicase Cas3' [Spirochaetales bacterium]|nr:CRISPR-associated helicase Cas3' [Spirochaetales bacterium]